MSERELLTVIHGMVLGILFLLAFAVALVELWAFKPRTITAEGIYERQPRLPIATWLMAIVAWLMVITGTWILYPWYRVAPPDGTTDLSAYPRYLLLSDEATAALHTFGMELKEHVAWIAPFLATSVAFIVLYYGADLLRHREMRWPLLIMFCLAFATAGIAGLFGALIKQAAPIQ